VDWVRYKISAALEILFWDTTARNAFALDMFILVSKYRIIEYYIAKTFALQLYLTRVIPSSIRIYDKMEVVMGKVTGVLLCVVPLVFMARCGGIKNKPRQAAA
jgi:hypothetical protein